MNNNSEGEESDTDSRDIINRGVPPSNIVAQDIPGPPIARLNLKNKFEYLIQKTRIIVGRSGGDVKQPAQDVDVSIDSCSLYISRRHFDVFTHDCIKFFVSVYSKNGLFVNGSFVRRGSAAYPLKSPSRLRFPKTDTKIIFNIFERNPDDCIKNEMISPTNAIDNDCTNNGLNSNHLDNNKLPANVQNYNTILQQQQQQQLQQLNISSPPFHNNTNNNMNDNMKMAMLSPQSKLEREVYKHQQQPQQQQQQQQQQQLQIATNRKRKFQETLEVGNQDWLSRGDYSDGRKPPFSYSQLIAQAIFSTSEHMLCLNDIYLYITKTYPFYRPEDKGWQNSIRHNLSLSKSFVRMPRANDEGKGSLWTIQPNDKQAMLKTAYRPRGTRDKYNALNHSHHTPNIFPTPSKNANMGDSEDSNELYQNEDEEAANNISHQAPHDTFPYMPPTAQEQFGEGDADQMSKGGQSTILQSSFANPMQIFMQPPGRRNVVQPNQQLQVNNLSQLQRNNPSASLQVVRLSQLSDNTQPSWQPQQQQQQQQQRPPQQIFIPQQQQLKLQQVGAASNSNNQRIIIVRSSQQQQQTQQQLDVISPTTKRIKLTPSSNISLLPTSEAPRTQNLLLPQQQPTTTTTQPSSNNQPLDFNSLPPAQQQQVLIHLQQHKKLEGDDGGVLEDSTGEDRGKSMDSEAGKHSTDALAVTAAVSAGVFVPVTPAAASVTAAVTADEKEQSAFAPHSCNATQDASGHSATAVEATAGGATAAAAAGGDDDGDTYKTG